MHNAYQCFMLFAWVSVGHSAGMRVTFCGSVALPILRGDVADILPWAAYFTSVTFADLSEADMPKGSASDSYTL